MAAVKCLLFPLFLTRILNTLCRRQYAITDTKCPPGDSPLQMPPEFCATVKCNENKESDSLNIQIK